MLRFLARLLRQLAGRGLQPLFFQNQWLLALRVREAADAPETNSCRLIVPPRGVCYADPFVFQKDGRHYLFFEEYRHDRPKGVISCLEVDALGNCSQPTVVLERDYHLSYPSVFAWQGEVYMMPETSYRETVELYRAVEFPYRWDLERVLFENVRLLDPTLCEHAGKFWLFAGIKGELRSINNALNLFFADSPLGPWKAHPKNPIVLDVRRARPAGRLFRVNGQLFRPAQDSSVRYGYAVTFHRVETLSETEYYEVPVGRIDPGWLPGNLATHTFNASVDFEVVDAQWRCSRYRLPYLSHPTASAPASIGGPASLWFQPPAT